MLVDPADYNDQMADHQDVAIITPQNLDDDVLEEHEPLADDCASHIPLLLTAPGLAAADMSVSHVDEAMRSLVLPTNSDLETEADTVFTWHIEDWRNLPRREHGPIMKCGGYPWYAIILAS
jgi:ubiquitin carboxyl-terminal hydrolase 7